MASESDNAPQASQEIKAEEEAEHNAIGAWGLIPHFSSRDIQRTIEYYTKTLHFSLGGTEAKNDPDKIDFASLYIGHPAYRANIYFFLYDPDDVADEGRNESDANPGFHPSTAMIGLATGQVDEYYERLVREGNAIIVNEIADRVYGFRQFDVRDHDGNNVQFFCFLEGGNPSDSTHSNPKEG